MSNAKKITVVVPFLNEKDNLPVLLERLKGVFAGRPEEWELLLVDDGSTDGSAEWAMEEGARDARVKLLQFSRNFGHQIAITAGLDHAEGDAAVVMDGDLQDPPEVIPELLAQWEAGAEVVYAVRKTRSGDGLIKKFISASFYWIFRHLASVDVPMNVGDFRLVDRCVLNQLKEMRETHRFVRAMTCWVGFRQASVEYDHAPRHSGESKYPYWKLARMAFDGITSFSAAPLRWIVGLGLMVCVVGGLWMLWIVWAALFRDGKIVPGWTSLMAVMLLIGGVQFVCMGMLGQYVSRIFEEGKRRPLYVLKNKRSS